MRDGLRWHRIERRPGAFDFSSWTPMLAAAEATGAQVIWDLLHYGWPDDLDIWSPAFVDRFAAFARAAARAPPRRRPTPSPFWCPVNEISFFAWAGGDAAYLNPFARGRGFELKVQLARAAIAAMHALRDVDPRARFVHCEPLIAIHHDPATGRPRAEAEGWHDAQYQAADLSPGRLWPQIGGDPAFLDIVGANYYPTNQWIHGGPPIGPDHPLHRPLSDLLFELHARTGRPILVSETGTEGDARAPWLRAGRRRGRAAPGRAACRSRASASTRSPTTSAGTTTASARTACSATGRSGEPGSVDPRCLAVIHADPLLGGGTADGPGRRDHPLAAPRGSR